MITFILPLPDSKLNPNRNYGRAYGASMAIRKKARNIAIDEVQRVLTVPSETFSEGVKLKVIRKFYFVDFRRRDLDNAESSAKLFNDGIFMALNLDDSCIVEDHNYKLFDKINPRLEISIIEIKE